MEKRRKSTIISVLAVAFCFLLISLAWAQLTGSDKAWIKRKLPNTLRRVSLPIWGITQEGTGLSVKWQDNAPNPRFAIYDPQGDSNPDDPSTWYGDLVLDKETGLVWERCSTSHTNWYSAIGDCYNKYLGGRMGWRLPTIEELASLLDPNAWPPYLVSGHPFGVRLGCHWSSTTYAESPSRAWHVDFLDGVVGVSAKSLNHCVWCVRGGQGQDSY